jgi:hypothetical protein
MVIILKELGQHDPVHFDIVHDEHHRLIRHKLTFLLT